MATELPQIKTDEEAAINISVADTSGLGDVYYSFQEKDDQPRSAPVLPPSSALRHPSHQSTNTGGHHLNMHGVFLHILADALGTIAVLISAIINYAFPRSGKAGGGEGWYGSNLMSPQPPFWLPPPPPPPPPPLQFPFSPPPPYFNNIQQQSEHSKNDWVVYIDPIASLIIAFLLINATFRLVKDSIYLLCQQAPRNLNINKIKEHILKDVDVENIHEFHVWTLNDSKIVASLHVVLLCPAAASTSSSSRLADPSRSRRVTDRLTRILHKHGIHNTTIQIEHMDGKSEENQKHVQEKIDHESSTCLIKCDSYAECIESSCCSYE